MRSKTYPTPTVKHKTTPKRPISAHIKVVEDYMPLESEITTESSTPRSLCDDENSEKAELTHAEANLKAALLESQLQQSAERPKSSISRQFATLMTEMREFGIEHNSQIERLEARIETFGKEAESLTKVLNAAYSGQMLSRPNTPLIDQKPAISPVQSQSCPSSTQGNRQPSLLSSLSHSQPSNSYSQAMQTLKTVKKRLELTLSLSKNARMRAEASYFSP